MSRAPGLASLGSGVNTGITPPATRLTGSTVGSLRYFQTYTARPGSAYDINNNRLRILTGNSIGRFVLANNTTPFDFGPALWTGYSSTAHPSVYDVKISMRVLKQGISDVAA